MTAQPASLEQQWAPAAADQNEAIIGKLSELGSGTGVGANFYPGAADELKVRFGDHKKGIEYVVLTPQQIRDVRAYIDRNDKPEFKKVRSLLEEAATVLARAAGYAQEYYASKAKISLPVATAVSPAPERSAPHIRAA